MESVLQTAGTVPWVEVDFFAMIEVIDISIALYDIARCTAITLLLITSIGHFT